MKKIVILLFLLPLIGIVVIDYYMNTEVADSSNPFPLSMGYEIGFVEAVADYKVVDYYPHKKIRKVSLKKITVVLGGKKLLITTSEEFSAGKYYYFAVGTAASNMTRVKVVLGVISFLVLIIVFLHYMNRE